MRARSRVIGGIYRLAAAGCAEAVTRVPACEALFLRIGPRAWGSRWMGRFYRSAADRVALRIRRAGSQFRRVRVGNTPLLLDVTEFTTRTLYFGRVEYEPKTTACLAELLGPGGLFVDVGANHGYFSLIAAACVGATGRVAAFEPNPAVFAQLQAHVRMNHFEDRVRLEPIALGEPGVEAARLFVSQNRENSGLSSLSPAKATLDLGWLSPDHTLPVRVETFDRWFAASGWPRVDLMKIDVEGAEARVVAGMTRSLASGAIAAIICETVSGSPAHEALVAAGYNADVLESVGPLVNVLYSRKGGRA